MDEEIKISEISFHGKVIRRDGMYLKNADAGEYGWTENPIHAIVWKKELPDIRKLSTHLRKFVGEHTELVNITKTVKIELT
jgi:hypothetical protein